MMTIGFIGLGHMGKPMALHLIAAGFNVYVYDLVREAVEALEKEGAMVSQSLSSLTQNVDVLITSVQTSQQVRDICLGEGGIFLNHKPNLLYIDCSSIDISVTKYLHELAEKNGVAMVDAPVSGGVAGAQAGTLTFMVGGSELNFTRAQPILQKMGKKIVHAGPPGNGQAAKICNNLILGISMIGVCEAFSLARKLGLDQKKFFEISANASGQCWAMTSYCPVPGILDNVPSNHGFQPGFMSKMMLKDLQLAYHAAESVGSAIPLGSLATQLYELYINEGFGERDFSGIINFIGNQETKENQ